MTANAADMEMGRTRVSGFYLRDADGLSRAHSVQSRDFTVFAREPYWIEREEHRPARELCEH